MSQYIPDRMAYFIDVNGEHFCCSTKNSKMMKKGREAVLRGGSTFEEDNKPRTNIKIDSGEKLELSNGFKFLVNTSLIMSIVLNSDVINQTIQCDLIWISGSTYCELVRVGSEEYNSALKTTEKKKTPSLPAHSIKIGGVYQTDSNNKYIYLGYGGYTEEHKKYSYYGGPTPPSEYKVKEGYCYKSYYNENDKQKIIDDWASRSSWDMFYFEINKTPKRFIKEIGYNGLSLQDVMDAAKIYHPSDHRTKTFKIGK